MVQNSSCWTAKPSKDDRIMREISERIDELKSQNLESRLLELDSFMQWAGNIWKKAIGFLITSDFRYQAMRSLYNWEAPAAEGPPIGGWHCIALRRVRPMTTTQTIALGTMTAIVQPIKGPRHATLTYSEQLWYWTWLFLSELGIRLPLSPDNFAGLILVPIKLTFRREGVFLR